MLIVKQKLEVLIDGTAQENVEVSGPQKCCQKSTCARVRAKSEFVEVDGHRRKKQPTQRTKLARPQPDGDLQRKKKLTTPSKRGQRLIKRMAFSCCVLPWSSSLRGEVPCLLAFIFTRGRKRVMCARNTLLLYHNWVVRAVPQNTLFIFTHMRPGLVRLVTSAFLVTAILTW